MRIIEGLDALPVALAPGAGAVVVVGVFDGVHLGHQRLLHELLEIATELRGTPTVVTFRNHPDAVLRGAAPPLLVSVPHRLRLLRRAGAQCVALLDFDERLRAYSAEDFAKRILCEGLRTKGLLLGYDSAIGKDREGTPERLGPLGAQLGFAVRLATPFTVDGAPISSTRIRTAIARGELQDAARLLGRWPSVLGTVVHGDRRGRALGFPTANVAAQSSVLPPSGVYAVEVLRDAETHLGVANLGTRPTFATGNGTAAPVLEVHVLDFQGDLYGATLEVVFRAKVRDEAKFAGADALRAQIARDVVQARAVLAP